MLITGVKVESYPITQGWILLEGPFSWWGYEYGIIKFDYHPAKRPYNIPGWDIENSPYKYPS